MTDSGRWRLAQVGYRDNGLSRAAPRGEPATIRHYRMDRADWERNRSVEVEIDGLEPCLDLLGAGQPKDGIDGGQSSG